MNKDLNEIHALLDRLVNHEKRHIERLQRMRLGRMQRLLNALNRPDHEFQAIHVLGSKGKGSTATFLAHLLAGDFGSVGLYTSPHLFEPTERVRWIQDETFSRNVGQKKPVPRTISHQDLLKALQTVLRASRKAGLKPTYFEALTAAAAVWFRERKLRWVVVEAGLGGRWDATTAFAHRPMVVITPIGHEHERILGPGLKRIATEKAAAIMEKTQWVVSASQRRTVETVLARRAREQGAAFLIQGKDWDVSPTAGKRGFWQVITPQGSQMWRVGDRFAIEADNFGLALAASHQLKGRCSDASWVAAVWSAVRLPCRWEVMAHNPPIVIDGAHTPESMTALISALSKRYPGRKWDVLFGCLDDKPVRRLMRMLQPIAARLIVVTGFHERAMGDDPTTQNRRLRAEQPRPWQEVLKEVFSPMKQPRGVLITGSLYWAACARAFLLHDQGHDGEREMK